MSLPFNPALAQEKVQELIDADTGFLPLAGGTMTGNINMGTNRITNTTSGILSTDVATYGQVSSKQDAVTTAQGDILYASAANTLSALAKSASATRYLSNTGASNNPAWAQVGLTDGVTGTLPVTNGGIGVASTTAYAVLCGGTTSTAAVQSVASVGTAGQVLTSNGAGALPTFQSAAGGTAAVMAAATCSGVTNLTGNDVEVTPPFDTETYDAGSTYNASTYTFTAPTTGWYRVTSGFSTTGYSASHVAEYICIVVTGTSAATRFMWYASPGPIRLSGGTMIKSLSGVFYMTAADTMQLKWGAGGGAQTVGLANGAWVVYERL